MIKLIGKLFPYVKDCLKLSLETLRIKLVGLLFLRYMYLSAAFITEFTNKFDWVYISIKQKLSKI